MNMMRYDSVWRKRSGGGGCLVLGCDAYEFQIYSSAREAFRACVSNECVLECVHATNWWGGLLFILLAAARVFKDTGGTHLKVCVCVLI